MPRLLQYNVRLNEEEAALVEAVRCSYDDGREVPTQSELFRLGMRCLAEKRGVLPLKKTSKKMSNTA